MLVVESSEDELTPVTDSGPSDSEETESDGEGAAGAGSPASRPRRSSPSGAQGPRPRLGDASLSPVTVAQAAALVMPSLSALGARTVSSCPITVEGAALVRDALLGGVLQGDWPLALPRALSQPDPPKMRDILAALTMERPERCRGAANLAAALNLADDSIRASRTLLQEQEAPYVPQRWSDFDAVTVLMRLMFKVHDCMRGEDQGDRTRSVEGIAATMEQFKVRGHG